MVVDTLMLEVVEKIDNAADLERVEMVKNSMTAENSVVEKSGTEVWTKLG